MSNQTTGSSAMPARYPPESTWHMHPAGLANKSQTAVLAQQLAVPLLISSTTYAPPCILNVPVHGPIPAHAHVHARIQFLPALYIHASASLPKPRACYPPGTSPAHLQQLVIEWRCKELPEHLRHLLIKCLEHLGLGGAEVEAVGVGGWAGCKQGVSARGQQDLEQLVFGWYYMCASVYACTALVQWCSSTSATLCRSFHVSNIMWWQVF